MDKLIGSIPKLRPPDERITWFLRPDPGRFDAFWFCDAGSWIIGEYRDYLIWIKNGTDLTSNFSDSTLYNRHAVRDARAKDMTDKEIMALKDKRLITGSQTICVSNDKFEPAKHVVFSGDSVLDAVEFITKGEK